MAGAASGPVLSAPCHPERVGAEQRQLAAAAFQLNRGEYTTQTQLIDTKHSQWCRPPQHGYCLSALNEQKADL